MFKLTLADKQYSCGPEETVLDVLLREHVAISYACRKGSCQSCKMHSLDTMPPAAAQLGLKDTEKQQNYFLACLCHPEQDMSIKLPDQSEFYTDGIVIVNEMLNRNTLLLILAVQDGFGFKPGQFVNLQRPDGLTRSYSITNIPQAANTLELHVRRLPGGKFSAWLHDEVKVGDCIAVSEPRGHCFYLPKRTAQDMLLIGTGTGLAPLAGILTDALAQGHTGDIYLFHGSREVEDLYLIEKMQEIAKQHSNFYYLPCLSGKRVPEGFLYGRVHDVALACFNDLSGWRVFLCGHPEMVQQMKTMVFLKGAASADIYADAFYMSPSDAAPKL